MANPPIGNSFHEGVLGVCRVNFDNLDMGLTVDEITIEYMENIKDILFAPYGTMPDDKIPTGQAYQVKIKFGEMTPTRMAKLYRGITVGDSGKSIKHGRDIYRSGKANFAKVLTLTRVDSDGNASADLFFKATFYKAMPLEIGPETFGPDTQRTVDVTFYCFYDTTKACYFIAGYPSSLGL